MPQQPYSHSWTMLDMFFFQRTTWTGSGQLLQQQLLVYSRGSERWLTLLGTMMWKGKATTKGFCMSGLQYLKSMDWFEGTLPGNIETTVFIMFYPPVFLTAFLCVPATSSHTSRRLKFWLPRVCEARSLRGGVQLSFCGVLHKHDRGCYHVLSLKSSVHDSWCVVFATFLMFHGTSMIFNVKRCVQVIS